MACILLPQLKTLYCAQLPQEPDDVAGDLQHDSPGDLGHLHLVCVGLCWKGLAQAEKLSTEFPAVQQWHRQVQVSLFSLEQELDY